MKSSIASRSLIALLLIAVPLSSAWATHRDDAEQAVAAAKALHEKAGAAGVAQDGAAEMIAEAEAMVATRQYTQAVKVATWAMRQDQFALDLASGAKAVDPVTREVADREIAVAIESVKKAASVGGEWRDTDKMIKEAETLASAGDLEQAIRTASMARLQGELGYEQAMRERDADMPEYMRAAMSGD